MNKAERIRIRFKHKVKVLEKWHKYLWDEPSGQAPLEKVVLRVLMYRNYEDWKEIYKQYPEVCKHVGNHYPQIHRGAKFGIKWWSDGN